MGLPGDESKPASTTQRRAYDLVAEGFGPGYNGPLTVVVQADDGGSAKTAAQDVAEEIRGRKDVAAVGQPRLSESGDTAVLNVVPATTPSSAETADLVHALRDPGLASENDAHVLVAGSTAMNVDVSQKLSDALLPYLGLVVGLAFLLLIAVFRSLLVPLKAALGFLLSVLMRPRRGGRGLPVGLAGVLLRGRGAGPGDVDDADLHGRRRLRPRHGL